MVTFIIQKDTLFTAAEEGDTNTLKYVLDRYPDGVNITTGYVS